LGGVGYVGYDVLRLLDVDLLGLGHVRQTCYLLHDQNAVGHGLAMRALLVMVEDGLGLVLVLVLGSYVIS